jgi:L-ascorbate metabolism protein UlaG (beta-lactamase superfamily)
LQPLERTFWGFTIVIDPFPATPQLGYPKPGLTADLVLATHEHFDHTRRIVGVSNRNTPCALRGIAIGPARNIRLRH